MKHLRKAVILSFLVIFVLGLCACKKNTLSSASEDTSIIVRPKQETSVSSSQVSESVEVSISEETGVSASTDTFVSEDPEPSISEETSIEVSVSEPETEEDNYTNYYFRSKKLLNQHFEKHGKDMGFEDAKAYEKAACDVINNPKALFKTEKEDGDYIYYIEETNEFVVLSTDGYIRTYFLPDSGKKYFDKQ